MRNVFLMASLLAILFTSCTSNNEETTSLAKIKVSLVDAPADYDAVLIEIVDIQVNVDSEEGGEKGWQSLEGSNPGKYDLLKLTNGEEAFMGEIELPEGKLGQIRLILGDDNELVIGTDSLKLSTPSASQSGLKVKVNADIKGGVTYKLILDFDAAKSIVKAGNSGKYNLKPVIRGQMEAQTGAIQGVVSPKEVSSVLYAISASTGDSISSYPNENGAYLIRALEAGTYKVLAMPDSVNMYNSATLEAIEVKIGEVSIADTLVITAK